MLSSDELLNGKCEYLSNTIASVRVDEDDLERKKRESREEAEERERIEAVNKFRVEKEIYIQGTKRKKREIISIQQARVLKKPRISSKYSTNMKPELSETPMNMSYFTQNNIKGTLLELEYIPVLAIEYVPTPVPGIPVEMSHVPDEPTHTPQEPTFHPAWWDQVLKQENRVEKNSNTRGQEKEENSVKKCKS